jgi:hypothetical protein
MIIFFFVIFLNCILQNIYSGQILGNGVGEWTRSQGSSVSIVSDNGLEDWVIELQSLTEAKDFSSSLYVQTSSGVHPAFYPVGAGVTFPRGKARSGRDADHLPPSSAELKNE